MAHNCKRPRSPGGANGGEGTSNAALDRFVRACRGPDSASTPARSQAGGSTLGNSTPHARPRTPPEDDRDPLPPGHPKEHPWEAACIIQRYDTIDAAKSGLRLAITATVADAT